MTPGELLDQLRALRRSPAWLDLEARGYRPCVALDADGTLWRADITEALVADAVRRREIHEAALEPFQAALTRYGEPPATTALEAVVGLGDAYEKGRLLAAGTQRGMSADAVKRDTWPALNWALAGGTVERLEQRTRELLDEGFRGEVWSGVRPLLAGLRELELRTVVVSAGIEPAVRLLALELGFPPDSVRGMRSRVVDGRLTAEIEPPVMYAEGKLEAARTLCGGLPILSLGDAAADSDRVMLEAAPLPVAVEPRGRHLALAREQGWPVLRFGHTEGGQPAASSEP
jgi:phosphoserine phosphatase